GAVSLGSRGDLFRAAAAIEERFLAEGPAAWMSRAAQAHASLHEAGVRSKAALDAGALYERFVYERLPKILARDPIQSADVLQVVLQPLRNLQGPLSPLGAAIEYLEREPAWYARIGRRGWDRFAGSMAQWRSEAGALGAWHPRLLSMVLAHLE